MMDLRIEAMQFKQLIQQMSALCSNTLKSTHPGVGNPTGAMHPQSHLHESNQPLVVDLAPARNSPFLD